MAIRKFYTLNATNKAWNKSRKEEILEEDTNPRKLPSNRDVKTLFGFDADDIIEFISNTTEINKWDTFYNSYTNFTSDFMLYISENAMKSNIKGFSRFLQTTFKKIITNAYPYYFVKRDPENIYGYKIDDAFYIENIINGEPAAITSDCSITESYYVDIKQKLSWRFFAGGVGNKDARNSTRKGEILKQFIYQCGLKVEELTSKMPLSVKHSSSTYIPRRRVKELFNENGNCKTPSYPTADHFSAVDYYIKNSKKQYRK